jgi:hypothetical protein
VIADMDLLTETHVEKNGKRFLLDPRRVRPPASRSKHPAMLCRQLLGVFISLSFDWYWD